MLPSRLISLALASLLTAAPAFAQTATSPADAPTASPPPLVGPPLPPAPEAAPSPPPAPDPQKVARQETELGQKAYDLGRFEEAITHYSAAYAVLPLPALLFNIGQCHRQLRQYDRAAFFYGRYLDLTPKASNTSLASELLQEVKTARGEPPPPQPERPLHQSWWFWAGAGVIALAAGGAVYYAAQPPAPTLGTLDGR